MRPVSLIAKAALKILRLLQVDRLKSWLASATSTRCRYSSVTRATFFLRDEAHAVEYAAPLRFGGRTKGALIVAFDKREDCDDTVCRLVDAAAQQAALAAHISSLYQAARDVVGESDDRSRAAHG